MQQEDGQQVLKGVKKTILVLSGDHVPEVQHMVHGEHMSHIRVIYACVTFLS